LITLDGFDGALFGQIDGYRGDLLAATRDLHRRIAQTRALGQLLTPDLIAAGRRVVERIGVRNQTPLFPPLFLTFLQHPEWITGTDRALVRMRNALSATPTVYRHFLSNTTAQPMSGLFELNVYDVLADAFPSQPQPRLTGTNRRSDVRVVIDGTPVFVEATVISEGTFWNGVAAMMHAQGLSVYSTAGPGPNAEARRIVSKIGEELRQTALDAPNVVVLSFFDTFPSDFARKWAFADLLAGGGPFTVGSDLSNLARVDSIFEFSRNRLLNTHVNPNTDTGFRLADNVRDRLRAVLASARFMIR
jgi:hypothetical protein